MVQSFLDIDLFIFSVFAQVLAAFRWETLFSFGDHAFQLPKSQMLVAIV